MAWHWNISDPPDTASAPWGWIWQWLVTSDSWPSLCTEDVPDSHLFKTFGRFCWMAQFLHWGCIWWWFISDWGKVLWDDPVPPLRMYLTVSSSRLWEGSDRWRMLCWGWGHSARQSFCHPLPSNTTPSQTPTHTLGWHSYMCVCKYVCVCVYVCVYVCLWMGGCILSLMERKWILCIKLKGRK